MRLIECFRSREASRARSVTPLRCSVASATWLSGLAGLRSSQSSTSRTASGLTCFATFSKRRVDALAQLVGDRKVASLDLDLHGKGLLSSNRVIRTSPRVGHRDGSCESVDVGSTISPRMPTMGGMTRPRRSPRRPPRRRRRPPADRRRAPRRRRLRAAVRRRERRRSTRARDAKATSALLVDAFGDIGLDQPRRPPPGVDVDRPQLPASRSARRPCGPTAPCCRSPPTRRATTCSPCSSSSAAAATRSRSTTTTAARDIEPLLGLCSIVKVDVEDRDDATLAGDHRRPEAARRAARGHRRRERRGLRALPRARLLLLPGRLLRQAAGRRATAASAPAASPRCARSAS